MASRIEDAEPADLHETLAHHIANVVREVLATLPAEERVRKQAEVCNEVIRSLTTQAHDEQLISPAQRLAAVYSTDGMRRDPPAEPDIRLSQSALLVNSRGEPNVGHLLQTEIDSADSIDLLIAFIRWSGLRLIEPKLKTFLESGRKLRVITTTYTGSTERRAIEHLIRLGAEVKVSYQTDNTRLHAKAWLFRRLTGFSTVFIGSSNLSTAAMVEGLEWNVRLAQADSPSIVEKFSATFESYWADPDFELYDPASHAARFDEAVSRARSEDSLPVMLFDIQPWPHQREILEKLRVERFRHNRWKNLVVAATGTGKTVVAALDFRGLCRDLNDERPLSLLFIAHRREILQQSVSTFRTVMRDSNFGELYVDGRRPDEWKQVFASVQSLAQLDLDRVPAEHFDVVIVDEFHHAAAPTYRRLLNHLTPRVLVGLTATPERSDGQSVLEWFDGRLAVELRLWDALERGLLSPFHYFGIHDQTDLSRVKWIRGSYDPVELANLYTGNDARLIHILQALEDKVSDVTRMRALGFCAGVSHAAYMARRFNESGIASVAILGSTSSEERDDALRKLRNGEINVIFAVDIFNEGVDLPEVDTVLFLRPTESPTIFLQQLGRGLRRSHGKECLTVLDFIGNANRNFRFDLRYRALVGSSRREVEEQVEKGFPLLPAGCAIQLDRETSRIVLENLRQAIGNRFSSLVAELRPQGRETTLGQFLYQSRLDPEDLYRARGWSWTRLKREAFPMPASGGLNTDVGDGYRESAGKSDLVAEEATLVTFVEDEKMLLDAFPRLLHSDDERRNSFLRRVLAENDPPERVSLEEERVLEGLLLTFFEGKERDREVALYRLWRQQAVRQELLELLDVLEDRAEHRTLPIDTLSLTGDAALLKDVPLSVHARYTRDEVLTAIGRSTLAKPFTHREGPLWHEPTKTNFLFITLDKSEKYYSPTTRYRDYAISPELFHWESQSVTTEAGGVGQRYIHHVEQRVNVMLLVRPANKQDGRTMPFMLLGPVTLVSHTGERPMSIVWRLHVPMPADLFKVAKVAAG